MCVDSELFCIKTGYLSGTAVSTNVFGLLFALANNTNTSTHQTRSRPNHEAKLNRWWLNQAMDEVSKIQGRIQIKKEGIVKLSNPFQDYCTLTMPLSVDQPRPRRDAISTHLTGHRYTYVVLSPYSSAMLQERNKRRNHSGLTNL
jgi:hypothetical protein